MYGSVKRFERSAIASESRRKHPALGAGAIVAAAAGIKIIVSASGSLAAASGRLISLTRAAPVWHPAENDLAGTPPARR
jgi:hypothetical protein